MNLPEKIARVRSALDAIDDPPGHLPPGRELTSAGTAHGDYPAALRELYRLCCAPECGHASLFEEAMFRIELVGRTTDGRDEHWLCFGLCGNIRLLVSLSSGEVIGYDPYFERYGEPDGVTVRAADVLGFVDEYLLGPGYAEFGGPDEDDEDESDDWYHLLAGLGML